MQIVDSTNFIKRLYIQEVELKCASSLTDSLAILKNTYNYTDHASTRAISIKIGATSHDMYFLDYIYNPTGSGIRRSSLSGSSIWSFSTNLSPLGGSLSVDNLEQNLYVITQESNVDVLKINTANGNIASGTRFSVLSGAGAYISLHILSDNSGYYIFGQGTNGHCTLCKHIPANFPNVDCLEVSSIISNAYVELMLTDNQFFMIGLESPSPHDFHMYKFTFGCTSVNWANMITCPSSSCQDTNGAAMLSLDQTLIYTLYLFDGKIIFQALNITTGSNVGTRFTTNTNCKVGLARGTDGDYRIFLFNTLTQATSSYIYGNSYLIRIINEPNSERIIMIGQRSGRGYVSRLSPEAIGANSDFSPDPLIMNPLSSGNYDLIPEVGLSISSPTTQSVTSSAFSSNSSEHYASLTSYTSDTYFQLNSQFYLHLMENSYIELSPDLPCSSSGSNSVTYSISDYNGVTVPDWISIDPNSGILKISTPQFSSINDYSFNIDSFMSESGKTVKKIIYLRISKCEIQNCK